MHETRYLSQSNLAYSKHYTCLHTYTFKSDDRHAHMDTHACATKHKPLLICMNSQLHCLLMFLPKNGAKVKSVLCIRPKITYTKFAKAHYNLYNLSIYCILGKYGVFSKYIKYLKYETSHTLCVAFCVGVRGVRLVTGYVACCNLP